MVLRTTPQTLQEGAMLMAKKIQVNQISELRAAGLSQNNIANSRHMSKSSVKAAGSNPVIPNSENIELAWDGIYLGIIAISNQFCWFLAI
jgi:DNA-binding transcriptional regulator YiaG